MAQRLWQITKWIFQIKRKDDINKGVDAYDTVNNKGLTFNADKGTTGVKKLGSQVAVNGDNKNIETVADANGVKVKTERWYFSKLCYGKNYQSRRHNDQW